MINLQIRRLLNTHRSTLTSHLYWTQTESENSTVVHREQHPTTRRTPRLEEPVLSSTQPHPLQLHALPGHEGWVSSRKGCLRSVPCVLSPSGMEYSLGVRNKLFRAFLSQSENTLFKQAANEAIHHLV